MPFILSMLLVANISSPVLTIPIIHEVDPETYIREEARKVGYEKRALYIARNESHFVTDARGDLDQLCKNKRSPYYGEPVTARGVWQITRCYHPEVSDKQADDLVWSTTWALERLVNDKTCRKEWSTCRKYLALSF